MLETVDWLEGRLLHFIFILVVCHVRLPFSVGNVDEGEGNLPSSSFVAVIDKLVVRREGGSIQEIQARDPLFVKVILQLGLYSSSIA
jgi:hypothetical protein